MPSSGRPKTRQDDALDVDRPEKFVRYERIAQKAGAGVLTLFVGAGLAGFFGNGPISEVTVTSGAVTLRFERAARQTYRTDLEVTVNQVSGPIVAISLPRVFLDRIDLLEARPPNTLKRIDDTLAMFEVPALNGIATLQLHYEPKEYGVLEADVVVEGQPPARLRQTVFF